MFSHPVIASFFEPPSPTPGKIEEKTQRNCYSLWKTLQSNPYLIAIKLPDNLRSSISSKLHQ
jgi:ADP-heptose:LPS heptosyltransferase